MPKIIPSLLCVFVFLALDVYAQEMKASPRSVCTRRCNESMPERLMLRSKELSKIRTAIANETDAEKLKILIKQEQEEISKIKDQSEEHCKNICQFNPE